MNGSDKLKTGSRVKWLSQKDDGLKFTKYTNYGVFLYDQTGDKYVDRQCLIVRQDGRKVYIAKKRLTVITEKEWKARKK